MTSAAFEPVPGAGGDRLLDATRTAKREWTLRGAAALAIVGALTYLTYGRLLPPFDLLVFLHAAHQIVVGGDPYGAIQSASFRTGHTFVYPYAVAVLFVPLRALGVAAASNCFLVLSAAAVVVSCHLFGRRGFAPSALALACSTTVIGLQMGTVNAWLLLGLAVAWSRRDSPWVGGLATGLVAVAKLFLVPMIIWLVLTRRYKAAAIAGAVLGSTLALGWAAGPLGVGGYARLLTALGGNESARSWGLVSLLQRLGLGATVAQAVAIGVGGAVLAGGVALARFRHDQRAVYCAAIITSLLISPIVWSSYLLLLVAPLLVMTVDDTALAVFAVASWALVTPDAATADRAVIGALLAVSVAGWALAARQGWMAAAQRIGAALMRRRHLAVVPIVVLVVLFVPSGVRSDLTAVVCVLAVAAHAWRNLGLAAKPT